MRRLRIKEESRVPIAQKEESEDSPERRLTPQENPVVLTDRVFLKSAIELTEKAQLENGVNDNYGAGGSI
jgi:hypothetical protein